MAIQTPDWVKQAIFYQIFPDRFARLDRPSVALSKRSKRSPYENVTFEPWEATPTLQGYKGGNLWGVIAQLDYLQQLGIDAIYFTPIFQSASNHRYHTHDYYQVDPILGGNEALLALLQEAHRRHMKVVLDGVFNHASRGFFFFNDILENGPYSPWLDWFKITDWPVSAYDGSKPANYVSWDGNRALPEFNHENPAVREYIMQVGEYWIEQGIDGWRLDVPYEITIPGFWQEFRTRIKQINPQAYIVGEVWRDPGRWLDGTQFDGVMNYLFCAPTIAFTAGDRVVMEYVEQPDYEPYPALDAPGYAKKIQDLLALYDWQIQLTQLNLLDSHDTARLLTIAGGDEGSVLLAALLLFTFPGAPCIYYGDEVGLPGGFDPDSRRSFPSQEHWNQTIYESYKQLIGLHRRYPALRTGDYRVLDASGLVYVFARILGSSEFIVAVNAGTTRATVTVDGTGLQTQPRQVLYGNVDANWKIDGQQKQLKLVLGERSGCILG